MENSEAANAKTTCFLIFSIQSKDELTFALSGSNSEEKVKPEVEL